MKLNEARRVLLFNYVDETGIVEMRHYLITVKDVGISRAVKSIASMKVPDLAGYDDISDFIIKYAYFLYRGAFAADSDMEDNVQVQVELPKVDTAQKRSIKLAEQGPRLNLKLVKIEDELCGGEILYHAYVKKSDEEIKALKKRKQEQKALKAKRRAEQERNVKLKEKIRSEKSQAQDQDDDNQDAEDLDYDEDDFSDLMEQDMDQDYDEEGAE
jgi:ribosome biogenesis protein SSF1/2